MSQCLLGLILPLFQRYIAWVSRSISIKPIISRIQHDSHCWYWVKWDICVSIFRCPESWIDVGTHLIPSRLLFGSYSKYTDSVFESPFDLQSLDRRCIGRLLDFKLADRARIIKALNQSTTVWSYIFWFRGMDVVELDSEEMIHPAGWEQQQLCAAIDVAQSFEWMDSLDLRANSASPTSQ